MSTSADNGKSRIIALEAFRQENARVDLPAFLQKHTYPFILLETKEGDFGDAGFQTLASKPTGTASRENDDTTSTTDLDIRPVTPVAEKHADIAKKLVGATSAHFVCPLVKRDVNKFASMITVGRAANNDVRLNLPSVSKFHAYFTHVQASNAWFVADANSSNGTFVNGEKLKGRTLLENGTAIRFGPDVVARFFDAPSFYEFLQQAQQTQP